MQHLPKTPDRSVPIVLVKRRIEDESKPNSGATIEELRLVKIEERKPEKIGELRHARIEEPRLVRIEELRPVKIEDRRLSEVNDLKTPVVQKIQASLVDVRMIVEHAPPVRIPD
ncbi:MAG TPA: hypothetical protein VMM56_08265 [Planctomycetaceae bacterium]|nr:hypothetical protein [Planctomycetaceae bacterium]